MAFTIRMVTLKIAYIILSHIVPVDPFFRALMVKILKYENKRRDESTLILQRSWNFSMLFHGIRLIPAFAVLPWEYSDLGLFIVF